MIARQGRRVPREDIAEGQPGYEASDDGNGFNGDAPHRSLRASSAATVTSVRASHAMTGTTTTPTPAATTARTPDAVMVSAATISRQVKKGSRLAMTAMRTTATPASVHARCALRQTALFSVASRIAMTVTRSSRTKASATTARRHAAVTRSSAPVRHVMMATSATTTAAPTAAHCPVVETASFKTEKSVTTATR